MSTSTLGGFESEERKQLFDEYLFQRRVLFGLSLSIVFMVFIWTVAICSDHWIIVTSEDGIFVPESGRYFLTSYTGLWRLCRHALTPVLLGNATLPVLLETLVLTNKSRIETIKQEIGSEPYIEEFQRKFNGSSVEKITKIDNQFKESLFAEWIRNTSNFPKLKAKYKELRPNDTNAVLKPSSSKTKTSEFKIIPYNMTTIEETLHGSQYTIVKRNRTADLLMPDNLRRALFNEWELRPNIILVLGEFAKSLEMSATLTTANGSRIILQPPVPPNKKQLSNGEFNYKKYGKKRLSALRVTFVVAFFTFGIFRLIFMFTENCKNHNFFPTDDEKEFDPTIDEVLLGRRIQDIDMETSDELEDLTRTQASFACFALLIMSMGFVFSMYTFLNPRYMFKRLAAGVHFISAAVCFLVLRIVFYVVKYEEDNLNYLFPPGADYTYGYAVYLAWLVFLVNALASITFLWYSKKRKGNKAPTEELAMADEPIGLGR